MAELLILEQVQAPCHKLPTRNGGRIGGYIDNLINKETETATRLLEVEELLVKQQATNLERSERLAKLENIVETKIPTKTYAAQ